jgi:hypothetical protein
MFRNVNGVFSIKLPLNLGLLSASLFTSSASLGAPATDIKLQCQIEIKSEIFHPQLGQTSREITTEIATVELLEFGKILSIGVTGSRPIADVISKTSNLIKSFSNRSTDTVWELSNERLHDFGKMAVKVRIDRNTGLLNYNSDAEFNNASRASETGSGYCSKVDTTKKKF